MPARLGRRCVAPGEVPAHDDGERHAGADLGDDRRPRRARHAPVEAVDEQHLEHGVDGVRREQDDERRAVVGRAALDALGAEGEHDERDPERADAQVRRAERRGRRRRRRGRRPSHGAPSAMNGATTTPTIADSHIVCTADVGAPRAVGRRRGGGRRARSCRRSGSCTPRRRARARSRRGPARRAAPCRDARRSPCRRGRTAARRRGCRAPAGRGRRSAGRWRSPRVGPRRARVTPAGSRPRRTPAAACADATARAFAAPVRSSVVSSPRSASSSR